ncbi:transketolase family protein [Zafaria sp. Z1313]|jgi:transketolase|uniref:transketolase family protein n=1 Tax=Micrococcaceae TaxID=1268 RepID=UPI002E75E0AC|nr:transketolase C-terminal domain-containing protein [Zafaria sp. J156]MEE1622863.1 transketolase C-terminal domain-containing protein [Zafaria sp. J156]
MSTPLIDPRKTFGEAVTSRAQNDDRIVVLSADSGVSSGFGTFKSRHPERYFEFGIQEHGVTGVASGLATTGRIPVFAAIAAFVTNRNYEAFRNDIAYMGQNVKIVGRNGGMTYSDLGPTHYSLEDYAIIRMLPGVVIISPQDPGEIRAAVDAMLTHEGPVYMRVGGPAIPDLFEEEPFVIGKGRSIRTGEKATVVTTGAVTAEAIHAVDLLAADGIGVDLIGMPTVEPVDAELITTSAARTGHVITVEEHYIRGGLSAAVSETIRHLGVRHDAIGLPHQHVITGTYSGLLQHYGLDAAGLHAKLTDLLAA